MCATVMANSGARMWINDAQVFNHWTATDEINLCGKCFGLACDLKTFQTCYVSGNVAGSKLHQKRYRQR